MCRLDEVNLRERDVTRASPWALVTNCVFNRICPFVIAASPLRFHPCKKYCSTPPELGLPFWINDCTTDGEATLRIRA